MYTKNKFPSGALVIPVILMMMWGYQTASGEIESFPFTSAKGIRIKIIKDTGLKYIKAQLIIFQDNQGFEPVIPHLTQMNIFDRYLINSNTGLLQILRRLGNDYVVDQHADHLHLKVNFLPNRFSNFTNFLKELYKYKAFTLKRYNDSTKKFWPTFFSRPDWKLKLARQLAYGYIFPDHQLGKILILNESLSSINLVKLRSYYKKNYRLTNSMLIIRGNLNPYVSYGLIEKGLQSFPKASQPFFSCPKPKIIQKRKIFILPNPRIQLPSIYWFDPFTCNSPASYFTRLIINELIFNKDIGLLVQSRSRAGNSRFWFEIQTDIDHHMEVSVISNSMNTSYQNIEKMILLADKAINEIIDNKISRKHYSDIINYFTGRYKINASDPDKYLNFESHKFFLKYFTFKGPATELIKTIKISSIKSEIPKTTFPYYNFSQNKTGVIVIAGNPEMILKHLDTLKPSVEIMDYQDKYSLSPDNR